MFYMILRKTIAVSCSVYKSTPRSCSGYTMSANTPNFKNTMRAPDQGITPSLIACIDEIAAQLKTYQKPVTVRRDGTLLAGLETPQIKITFISFPRPIVHTSIMDDALRAEYMDQFDLEDCDRVFYYDDAKDIFYFEVDDQLLEVALKEMRYLASMVSRC